MSLLDLVTGLAEAGVRYVAIGGVAGVAHGSRRVTDDLDILYDTEPENSRRLAAALVAWHAYPRDAEPGLPFLMDERTLRNAATLTLTTDRGFLDVFREVRGLGRYEDAVREATSVDLGSARVVTLSLPQLIAAKRAANRPKDREHLLELEALLELGRKPPRGA